MTVAGVVIPDPASVLVSYAREHSRTITEFDLMDGDPDHLTTEDVQRTRVISSRISAREVDWFVQRAATAPWSDVSRTACLEDADATTAGVATYRTLEALYDHFRTDRPRNVNVAKISKVLHLKRRHAIPSSTAAY